MMYVRQYPWFSALIIFIGAVFATEIGGLCERLTAARRLELGVERKRREREKLTATTPAPTVENAAAIESELEEAVETLGAAEDELRGSHWPMDLQSVSAAQISRTDFFFILANFVEKYRTRALTLGIGLEPDERFGFSAYANEAPATELVATVRRQQQVVEYLLVALFTAGPSRLLAVEREEPAVAAARPANLREPLLRDFFTIDPAVSARRKGLVEASAFRLIFVGPTAVLRTFLTKLAEYDLPVIVRGIEVESAASVSAASTESRSDTAPGPGTISVVAEPGPVPAVSLVRPALSKFTVTVELIELAESSALDLSP